VSFIEGILGRTAMWNLCVSRAMRKDLKRRWAIKALTLYDKVPAWMFRPLSMEEQHNFLNKLMKTEDFLAIASSDDWTTDEKLDGATEVSMFSFKNFLGQIQFRSTRPFLLVSPTSWTQDEDFSMLLDVLVEYDNHGQLSDNSNETSPNLLVVITGKGTQKEHYQKRIEKMQLKKVRIVTTWLSAEDYPKLLACANLGISMHVSSLGLDLPMKIVDMFECHLPVLAKRFKAIGEQVIDGSNGVLFDSSVDLKAALIRLATGFPLYCQELDQLKKALKYDYSRVNWEKQWNKIVWPLVQSLLPLQLYDDDIDMPLRTADETIDDIPEMREMN